jgi:hypothetical protein
MQSCSITIFRKWLILTYEFGLNHSKIVVLIWQSLLPDDGALAPKHVAALYVTLICGY